MAFPDGYWDQDTKTGGAGFIMMGPKNKAKCAGGMIPPHLRNELTSTGLKQRNTQAELLAIWCLVLCSAKHIAGNTLYIADDSTGTVHNLMSGSSAAPDSRAIVGNIWILAASLDLEVYIQHIPGVLTQEIRSQDQKTTAKSWKPPTS